jgi:NAD(P)-dependent dehydrogenase (short-subunit alcohol dehydrogenase family)
MKTKTILITGASGNLGSAVIRTFAEFNYNLVLISRNTEKNFELIKELNYPEDKFLIISGDVTSESSIEDFVKETIGKFNNIDILIHIAGTYNGGKPLYDTSTEIWDNLFNLNAKSLFFLSKSIVPIMIKQGSGIIITLSSKSALETSKNSSIYSASKNVTLKLTESLAKELNEKNIRVNCILPSIIDTPENRKSMPNQDFTKWINPDSIAGVIKFLISDDAKDINGASVPVYGNI